MLALRSTTSRSIVISLRTLSSTFLLVPLLFYDVDHSASLGVWSRSLADLLEVLEQVHRILFAQIEQRGLNLILASKGRDHRVFGRFLLVFFHGYLSRAEELFGFQVSQTVILQSFSCFSWAYLVFTVSELLAFNKWRICDEGRSWWRGLVMVTMRCSMSWLALPVCVRRHWSSFCCEGLSIPSQFKTLIAWNDGSNFVIRPRVLILLAVTI